MPYIPQKRRAELKTDAWLSGRRAEDVGELNFCITTLVLAYLEKQGIRYQTLNDVVGVLGQVDRELNRRVIVPYEDLALAKNGDVYPKEKTSCEA